MRNTIKYTSYTSLLSLLLVSCSLDFDQPVEDTPDAVQESGDANFSTFVALGDSLTAGFSDGALYTDGQNNSFANMLATQMQAAGGGTFTTPLMSDNFGGFAEAPEMFPPRLILDAVNLAPVRVSNPPTTSITNVLTGPFNNMGVTGAKVIHFGALAAGYGEANPYFGRFASSPSTYVLADAVAQNPTFFSLWIGANDVLGYATSGGDSSEGDSITDPGTFAFAYNDIVTQLTDNGAEGLLTNIPSVTVLPFFTTVPHNPVPLDAETAAGLNSAAAYGAYNEGLLQAQAAINAGLVPNVPAGFLTDAEIAKRTINFEASESNAVVIFDESLTDLTALNPALISIRQATSADLIVLTAGSFIGTQEIEGDSNTTNGVAIPLADNWVLTPEEQTEIATATAAFNATIASAAETFGLALYDAAARLNQLADDGISVNGSLITNAFATGGFFSLDGIHISPKGNGIMANEMIEVINDQYGSTLEPVQTRDLPGVYIR